MRGEVESTGLPGVDPTALVTAGKRMTITRIVRRIGDIQEKIDPHATMVIGRISTEIILESPEEVLHKTEVISRGKSKEEDQETNTGHTVLSVTMVMFLHTEVETGEDLPHTAQVEGTKATAIPSLRDTGENHVALEPDTAMMAEITDRALGLKGECPEDREEDIPESHQQGVDKLSSVRGLHLVRVETRISNVGDVEEWATRLKGARCFPIGEENRAIVVCFTNDETATVPLELFSRRW